MASLIHEETGTGQSREGEPVSELAMRAEPVPLDKPSASDGLTANQGTSQPHDLLRPRWPRGSTAIDYPYESAIGSMFPVSSS